MPHSRSICPHTRSPTSSPTHCLRTLRHVIPNSTDLEPVFTTLHTEVHRLATLVKPAVHTSPVSPLFLLFAQPVYNFLPMCPWLPLLATSLLARLQARCRAGARALATERVSVADSVADDQHRERRCGGSAPSRSPASNLRRSFISSGSFGDSRSRTSRTSGGSRRAWRARGRRGRRSRLPRRRSAPARPAAANRSSPAPW